MIEMTMKELKLHTLRGDIRQCLRDGMTERGIVKMLENRYVNLDSGITVEEFYKAVYDFREYAKKHRFN